MRYSALVLGLWALLGQNAHAECLACSVSRGVRITLRDGSVKTGYIQWNEANFSGLVNGHDFSGQPDAYAHLDGTLPSGTSYFDRWVGLVNYIAERGVPQRDLKKPQELTLYRELAKIRVPSERWVGITGKVDAVSLTSIARIEKDASLALDVDMTGIDVLDKGQIRRLAEEKPDFTVEIEEALGATVYVVYGQRVTLHEVLEHAAHASGGNPGDVLVNRIRIRGGHSGAGPAVPVEKAPELERFRPTIEAFLAKLGESDIARCDEEQSALQKALDRMPLNDPGRNAIFDRQHELRVKCRKKPQKEKPNWKPLGDKNKLRNLGIVVYSYAWD